MTDHSSKARLSPGKPLSTTQKTEISALWSSPVLTPQFNHSSVPDKTTGILSSTVTELPTLNLNHKKLVS